MTVGSGCPPGKKEELFVFKDLALGKLVMLQWRISHTVVYGQHKLNMMHHFCKKEDTILG